ncbi:MAG: HD domain-containing protein [Candidatus Omnitrophica bacterium]|nr:HD domain-containing protein [Candidatus Omnitrophota bacterium]
MTFGNWGLFAVALTSLGVGFFVYAKNRAGLMNQTWLHLSLATSLWALATGFMILSPSMGWGFVWARTAQAIFGLIPVLFLRFTLALLNGHGKRPGVLAWNERAAGLMVLLSLTPLMIRDLQTEPPFRFYGVAGPFYGFFALWFAGLFLYAIGLLLKEYRTQVGYKRNQLLYVVLASLIGLASFLSMMPLAVGIPMAPVGQGLLVFYALIGYAIVRWRLMDVSIVVKNTLIYTSLYSILVGLFVVVVVFLGQLLFYGPQSLDKRVLWMCVVALSIVTGLVRPLDTWLTRLTDRLLFQRKYEWQKTLKEASKGMSKVTSVERLLQLMAHFIGMRVRVTHVAILHRAGDHYTLKVTRGRAKLPFPLQMDRDNPLVAWLEEKKEPLSADEVEHWLKSDTLFPDNRLVLRRTLAQIQAEMVRLKAELCVPAFSKDRMMGFLVLGEKLSGKVYTQEDVDLLSTLANEGAIALENAQLYEQLFHRMHQIEDLYQREHRLFIHTAIALAAAVDARDPYTHGHTERCTSYAMAVADEMGPNPEIAAIPRFKEMLNIAALLHDIGKIGVSDEILRKKGKLTPTETRKMQEHPIIGAIILQPIKGMEEVAKAVKAHQERFDGKGYPDRLRGSEVPVMARIIAVTDTFDAMTTDRPYRRRLSDEAALREISACSGTQFDPSVVAAFFRAYQKGLISNRPVDVSELLGREAVGH